MNPHQAPIIHNSGTYNNNPQQQSNNVLNSMYQPPVYQSYPQQYISPAQPMVGYRPVYHNPQANSHPNMGNAPQRDLIPGNQRNQMIPLHHPSSMHNQQMDVLSNIQEPYHQNPIQWPPNPRPFPSDPQFFQYSSNHPMYMPRPIPPAPPPPPSSSPPLQLNQPQMRPPFYPSYQSNHLQQQQVPPHSTAPSRSFQNPGFRNSKKSNSHQTAKNQNKTATNSNNNNNNHNNTTLNHNQNQTNNQPKSKNKSKKQKKQSGHDLKKQGSRDASSIDRIPTSTIVEKQCQKWGWVLPPLPHRSLNNKTNTSNSSQVTTDNSNPTENHSKTGFTFSLKSLIEMDNQEEEEINNENNDDNKDDDDDILYNDNSEDNDNNNNDNSNDSENDEFYNDDNEEQQASSNEMFSNTDNSSDENNESVNNEEQQASSNENSDLFDKYRDNPIKRTLFLWDEIFKT